MTDTSTAIKFSKGADRGRYIGFDHTEDLTYLVVSHLDLWHLTIYGTTDLQNREAVTFHDTRALAYATAQAYAELGPDHIDAQHGGKSRMTVATLRAYEEA